MPAHLLETVLCKKTSGEKGAEVVIYGFSTDLLVIREGEKGAEVEVEVAETFFVVGTWGWEARERGRFGAVWSKVLDGEIGGVRVLVSEVGKGEGVWSEVEIGVCCHGGNRRKRKALVGIVPMRGGSRGMAQPMEFPTRRRLIFSEKG